jgi:hypothetical protein
LKTFSFFIISFIVAAADFLPAWGREVGYFSVDYLEHPCSRTLHHFVQLESMGLLVRPKPLTKPCHLSAKMVLRKYLPINIIHLILMNVKLTDPESGSLMTTRFAKTKARWSLILDIYFDGFAYRRHL